MKYHTVKQVNQGKMLVGRPFKVGRTLCRWFEEPESVARLEGFADEIGESPKPVSHKGWFLHDHFQNEVARGIVYRLPHGRGFLCGIADPFNNGPAILSTEIFDGDDLRGAAREADHLAEVYAEAERDYSRAADARLRHDELGEEVKSNRLTILSLCREIKTLRNKGEFLHDEPTITASLRKQICRLLDDIKLARDTRYELFSNFSRDAGWTDG